METYDILVAWCTGGVCGLWGSACYESATHPSQPTSCGPPSEQLLAWSSIFLGDEALGSLGAQVRLSPGTIAMNPPPGLWGQLCEPSSDGTAWPVGM